MRNHFLKGNSQALPLASLLLGLLFTACNPSSQPEEKPVEVPNPWTSGLTAGRVDFIDLNSDYGEYWSWSDRQPEQTAVVDRALRQNFIAGQRDAGSMVTLDTLRFTSDNLDWLGTAFPDVEIQNVEAQRIDWGWQSYDGVVVTGASGEHPFRAELAEAIPGIGLARFSIHDQQTGQQHEFELAAIADREERLVENGWNYRGTSARVLFEDPDCWPLYQLVRRMLEQRPEVALPVQLEEGSAELGWGAQGRLLASMGYFDELTINVFTGQAASQEKAAAITGLRVVKQQQGFDRMPHQYQVDFWFADTAHEPEINGQTSFHIQELPEENRWLIENWQIERGEETINILDQMYVQAAEERTREFYDRFFEADQAITRSNFSDIHQQSSERLLKMPDPTEDPHYAKFEVNPMTGFPMASATRFEVGEGKLLDKSFNRSNASWRRTFEVPVTVFAEDAMVTLLVNLVSSSGSRNQEYWLPQIDDFKVPGGGAPSYLDQLRER